MNARKMIRAVILGIAASSALFVSGCSDGNKAHRTRGLCRKKVH
ncbi:MAG: hypothetical protein ACLVHE_02845 [Dialister invisus]